MARIVHCLREKYDIYIGRSHYPGEGLLGNPYSHQSDTLAEFKVATRVDAIAAFKVYAVERMARDPEFRAAIMACKGRTLGCWCAPKACHGSVILELAEECPTCHGDSIVESKPAGAGYADDLPEYVPCPDCRPRGQQPLFR